MAKDIVILNISESQGGVSSVHCVFWFTVTSAYPNPSFLSAYQDIGTDSNTSGIAAALQAGTVVEEVHAYQFPTDSIVNNWNTVKAIILAFYNARKTYRASTLPDPGLKYKIVHDTASGWSA